MSSTAKEKGRKKLLIVGEFIKIIMSGSLTKLSVPPGFCKCLTDENSKEAVLTTYGEKWRVKVQKCKRGLIYFELGWDEFACDHGLRFGDFLLFKHKGGMKFDVSLFGLHGSEKEYPREKLGDERERAASGDPAKKVHGDVKHINTQQ